MFFLLAIAYLLKRYGTQAVPLPVPSPTSFPCEAPIFAGDTLSPMCHSRTVVGILWSCLATTIACTWVSVHPNVPFRDEGRWTLLLRRSFLMFFSILAPEFMIMWAFKQWRGAVFIKESINEAFPKPELTNPWTTTHGHFLQMGGFRICMTAHENFYFSVNTGSGLRRKAFVDDVAERNRVKHVGRDDKEQCIRDEGLDKPSDDTEQRIPTEGLDEPSGDAEQRIRAERIGHDSQRMRAAALGLHPDHNKQIAALSLVLLAAAA